MPTATVTTKLDLNADGVYEQDISAYLVRDQSFAVQGIGREDELSQASESTFTLELDNADGRFSPKNSAGPYFDNLHPGIGIQVQVTFNALTYDWFTGIVQRIQVRGRTDEQRTALTCVDQAFVAMRTDTRLPLMEDAETGLAIHRLLDHAEEGEKVTNTRFEVDLDGYSAIGSASAPERVTTGHLVHPPAAMDIETANVTDSGWQYALPHSADSEFQGRRVTVSAYVWAEEGAAVGKFMKIHIADNLGNRGSQQIILGERPRRVAVTGTFAAAATDFFIEVKTFGIQGVFTFRTGAVHAVLAVAAIGRSIDAGQTVLKRLWYHRSPALDALRQVANDEGGLFYFDAAGKAVHEDRHHRFRETASRTIQSTIDGKFDDLPYAEDLDDRPSEVALQYVVWDEGAETTAFVLSPVPRTIPALATLTVEIPYGGTLVRNAIVPVANTDYKINERPDGGGADESGNVTVTFKDFGGGAEVKIENTVSRVLYLTLLQVRGTPVREQSDQTVARATPTTGPKLKNEITYAFRWLADPNTAQNRADYLAKRYGDKQLEDSPMSLSAPWPQADVSGTNMVPILARKVSDRVSVVDNVLPFSTRVNGSYYIERLDRSIEGELIVASWLLTPVDPASYLIWDTGSWGTDEWAA